MTMSAAQSDRQSEPGAEPSAHRGTRQDYLVRRSLVVALVVGLIAIVAIGVGRLIGSDTDDSLGLAESDGWNTVILLRDHEIQLVEPSSGDLLDTHRTTRDPLEAQSATAERILVLLDSVGILTQVDLSDGMATTSRVERDGTLAISRGNHEVMAVAPAAGGELTIVDTRTGDTIAVGEAAGIPDPLMLAADLLVNASGSHAAISDRGTFQTVLVDLSDGTTKLLGGQVAALNDTTAVTVQRAGDQAELDFYELSGDRIGTVDVASPAAVMLTGERTAVTVSDNGQISTISSNGRVKNTGGLTDGESETVTVLDGFPALADRRLVVETIDDVIVVDEDGDVIIRSPGQPGGDVTAASRCIVVGNGTTTGRSVQIDLDSGAELGTLTGGIVAAASLDGCTAAIIGGATPQVIQNGTRRVITIERDTLTGMAPDGSVVVASGSDGADLITITDTPVTISIADEATVVHFAEVP